jgi:hypothetical protein
MYSALHLRCLPLHTTTEVRYLHFHIFTFTYFEWRVHLLQVNITRCLPSCTMTESLFVTDPCNCINLIFYSLATTNLVQVLILCLLYISFLLKISSLHIKTAHPPLPLYWIQLPLFYFRHQWAMIWILTAGPLFDLV